jgi:hypothetical protein
MKTKKLNPQQEVFVKEMAEHGDRIQAYRTAYPDAGSSIYNSAHRLSHRPEVKAAIDEANKQKEAEKAERMEEEYYQRMVAIEKKRTLLSKIINGEMLFEKLAYTREGVEVMKLLPSVTELCRVIDMDNALAKEMGMLQQKLPKRFFIGDKEFF